jgi:hypothetical protein
MAICVVPMLPLGAAAQPAGPLAPELFSSGTTGDLGLICVPDPLDPARLAALGYCHGFIAGVGQVFLQITRPDGPFRPFFCLPEVRPSLADVGRRFAEWSRAHPQHAIEPAAEGLLRFATATYPCTAQPARAAAPSRPSR